jgi:hypothetical protein
MPAYTVERISEGVPKGEHGNLSAYATLKDEGGLLCERVNLFVKKLPVEGETIRGTIEDGQYGPKFKREKPQGGGWDSSPFQKDKSPEERRRIVRQHSQEMALRHVHNKVISGQPMPESWDELRKVIDWFDKDVEAKADQS